MEVYVVQNVETNEIIGVFKEEKSFKEAEFVMEGESWKQINDKTWHLAIDPEAEDDIYLKATKISVK